MVVVVVVGFVLRLFLKRVLLLDRDRGGDVGANVVFELNLDLDLVLGFNSRVLSLLLN